MFKEGDLFFLNEKGKTLFKHYAAENGIVIRGPYLLYEQDYESRTRVIQYHGYDILIQGRLFIEIPQRFLQRIVKHEENTK